MERDNRVAVSVGQVAVREVAVVADGEDFIALEVDLASKYPEAPLVTWSSGDEVATVELLADERTLRASLPLPSTRIRLPARTAGWTVMTDAARYTVRIVAWKRSGDPWLAWPGDSQRPATGPSARE